MSPKVGAPDVQPELERDDTKIWAVPQNENRPKGRDYGIWDSWSRSVWFREPGKIFLAAPFFFARSVLLCEPFLLISVHFTASLVPIMLFEC